MRKRVLFLLTICLIITFSMGCNIENTKVNVSENDMNEIKKIYDKIYEDYLELVRLIYVPDISLGDEIRDENDRLHRYVEEEAYHSVEDIEKFMNQVCSPEYINQKLYWVLGGEYPQYKEINGRLCLALQDAMATGIAKDIIKVEAFNENSIVIITQDEDFFARVSLIYLDGIWLIDNIEDIME